MQMNKSIDQLRKMTYERSGSHTKPNIMHIGPEALESWLGASTLPDGTPIEPRVYVLENEDGEWVIKDSYIP